MDSEGATRTAISAWVRVGETADSISFKDCANQAKGLMTTGAEQFFRR
jgi:hypothetical protein